MLFHNHPANVPMPHLPNPRHESFAQARAKGARLDDAYEDAGFVLHRGHSSRLARRPEVAERIAELRADRNEAEAITPQRMIAALLRMAKAGEGSVNTARVKEARLALLDAARLQAAETDLRHRDQLVMIEQSAVEAAPQALPAAAAAPAAPAAPPALAAPERPRRLPETCLEPARTPPRPAGRRPLDGPSPAALLPAPAARLPVSCLPLSCPPVSGAAVLGRPGLLPGLGGAPSARAALRRVG
jgi:hypothetical protein